MRWRFSGQFVWFLGLWVAVDKQSDHQVDQLDASLLKELLADARIGVLELSRRLGVARGTVQARLQRLVTAGVVTGFKPELSLQGLGYKVKAYVTVEVTQGQIDSVVQPLAEICEVLEVHSVAAQGDLLCLVAARSNEHMMEVLERVLAVPDVARTSTAIVLKTQVENRSHQLLAQLIGE
jgi:DNA-binding Lrp family transcriptional regulator